MRPSCTTTKEGDRSEEGTVGFAMAVSNFFRCLLTVGFREVKRLKRFVSLMDDRNILLLNPRGQSTISHHLYVFERLVTLVSRAEGGGIEQTES
jgi:hypothetical protein